MKFAVIVSGTVQRLNLDPVSGTCFRGRFQDRFETRSQEAFPELVSKRDFQLRRFHFEILGL